MEKSRPDDLENGGTELAGLIHQVVEESRGDGKALDVFFGDPNGGVAATPQKAGQGEKAKIATGHAIKHDLPASRPSSDDANRSPRDDNEARRLDPVLEYGRSRGEVQRVHFRSKASKHCR